MLMRIIYKIQNAMDFYFVINYILLALKILKLYYANHLKYYTQTYLSYDVSP